MRRALSGLLSLTVTLCLLLSLISCGEQNRTYDEEEVLAAARVLLPAAEKLNEIYYGDGIRPDLERSEEKNGVYYPAVKEDLGRYGITTVDSLKEKTREVFTVDYATLIFSTKLSSVSDGDSVLSLSRFYQAYDGTGADKTPTLFMVNSAEKGLLVDTLTYHYDTLSVDGSEGNFVYVTLTVTAQNDAGESVDVSLRVGLLEEEDGWRIDTPTYARYKKN